MAVELLYACIEIVVAVSFEKAAVDRPRTFVEAA